MTTKESELEFRRQSAKVRAAMLKRVKERQDDRPTEGNK